MQVYLTPEEHQALREEAHRSGVSMTEVVRNLIETHLLNGRPSPTDFRDLLGIAPVGRRTDFANTKDHMLRDEVNDLYGHKRALREPGPR